MSGQGQEESMDVTGEEVKLPVSSPEEPLLGDSRDQEAGSCASRCFRKTALVAAFPLRLVWNNGVACMLVGSSATAFAAIFVKYMDKAGVPLMEALTIRIIVCLIVFLAASQASGVENKIKRHNFGGLLIASSLLGGVAGLTLWLSFEHMPSGDAMALNRFKCIPTAIFSWIIGWESINWIMFLGVLLASIGEIAIVHPPFLFGGHSNWNSERVFGILFAVISIICMSIRNMMVGKIGTRLSTLTLCVWSLLGGLPFPIISLIISYPDPIIWTLTLHQLATLAGFTALGIVQWSYILRSLQLCNATLGDTLATSNVVLSYALGFILLGEKVGILAAIGTILIIVGIWVLAAGKTRNSGDG